MHGRNPRRIKRYMTEPDDLELEHKTKYSNLTFQEIKLQLNPFEALSQIRVPSVYNNHLNIQRTTSNSAHLQQKYYLPSTLSTKVKEIRLPRHNTSNGYKLPQTSKGALMFKKSHPLFIVNTLMDILKDDNKQSTSASAPKKNQYRKKDLENNEFNELESKSLKFQRAPRLVENQINRLTQLSKYSQRKIYSEQKSRQKVKDARQMQLLTFYKPRKAITLNNVSKLS